MLRHQVGHQPLILTAASVMIHDKEGRILLQHRTDTNNWGLPGGFMEPGETIEETAKREIKEETGLTIDTLIFFHVFSGKKFYFEYPNGDKVYNVIVSFTAPEPEGNIIKNEESYELVYFTLDELPKNIIPTTRRMLDFYLEKKNSTNS